MQYLMVLKTDTTVPSLLSDQCLASTRGVMWWLPILAGFVILYLGHPVVNQESKMPQEGDRNHLSNEQSPYLRQHASNPVAWYPWTQIAFDRARELDRPVFLSIGYSTCHWCHVMAHESFEDETVAQLLNDDFISIKVDREERPDIDHIYMTACQMMTGSGGWPLTIVMTPDGRPFYRAAPGMGGWGWWSYCPAWRISGAPIDPA